MAHNLSAPASALENKFDARGSFLATLANLKPLSQEDADLINNAVMEARENGSLKQQTANRRERVMALRAKLKPISPEDAARIDDAITEAREASIAHDLSA